MRHQCTGFRPVHFLRWSAPLGLALALAALPAMASAKRAPPPVPVAQPAPPRFTQTVDDFYRARNGYPLWLSPTAGDAAQNLLALLATSTIDGIDPNRFQVAALRQALDAARSGKRKPVDDADRLLSAAFVAYVTDLRTDRGTAITYVDPNLRTKPPTPLAALLTAAAAPSLGNYIRSMGWMNPIYAQLRDALAAHNYSTDEQGALIGRNLQRARALPSGKQRYILVNAAQQRLTMFENGAPVDSMVVVVGKPKWPTPMLTAYVRYAALNPYWYVPSDLAGEDVGQFVVKQGLGYLDKMGYQIVSDWTPNPTIIDPKTIDWKGVVAGKVEVMIRQKPGPQNFMGRMKFMFPNDFGVYLHDNPRRELFLKATRYFSGGCVRLEDAPRLGRWLFGHDLDWQSAGTEQPVMLAVPVPVYITYLTAVPDGNSVAYYDDAYGRDGPKLAGPGAVPAIGATAAPAVPASAAASSGNK